MHLPIPHVGWQARLGLDFARREPFGTILSGCRHEGPLRLQKPLYPEGPGVCHAIVLHPPSGVAGGDELRLAVAVGERAHALLTSPGAGKWYRSDNAQAFQGLEFSVGAGAVLEWLPQENIVFDAARVRMESRVHLAADAVFIGWEVLCLGRRACGETFREGSLQLSSRIERQGTPLWLERGRIDGGSALLASPTGLAGQSVCATLLASGGKLDPELIAACRAAPRAEAAAQCGISALPDLFVARYLGHSAEAARAWMVELWQHLRAAWLGRPAIPPRIWNT